MTTQCLADGVEHEVQLPADVFGEKAQHEMRRATTSCAFLTDIRPPQNFQTYWETMFGLGDRVVVELLDSNANERNAALSADGRWIAYQSDKAWQNEIYVRPFPDLEAGRWQVSRTGGTQPIWSPDPNGQELFYWNPAPSLVVVPVRGEDATLRARQPGGPVDSEGYPREKRPQLRRVPGRESLSDDQNGQRRGCRHRP